MEVRLQLLRLRRYDNMQIVQRYSRERRDADRRPFHLATAFRAAEPRLKEKLREETFLRRAPPLNSLKTQLNAGQAAAAAAAAALFRSRAKRNKNVSFFLPFLFVGGETVATRVARGPTFINVWTGQADKQTVGQHGQVDRQTTHRHAT